MKNNEILSIRRKINKSKKQNQNPRMFAPAQKPVTSLGLGLLFYFILFLI